MKKILLSSVLMASVAINAQTTIFEDSFETYTNFLITGFGNWQTLDLDLQPTYSVGGTPAPNWTNVGTPQAYIIFNPTAAGVTNSSTGAELRNFDPKTGSKYAAAWASVPSTSGGPTANEDWLISPSITLGSTGNSLTFWVKSLSSSYGLEKYKVGIYTGSGAPTSSSNFTIISGATALSAPYGTWEQKTYSLDAYAGQSIKIGIQCVSSDNYMFMVDDFKVTTTGTLGTNEVSTKSNLSISPNPTSDYLNIKGEKIEKIEIFDLSGKKVQAKVDGNRVDVRNLSSGSYLINIETKDGKRTEKFIKK